MCFYSDMIMKTYASGSNQLASCKYTNFGCH